MEAMLHQGNADRRYLGWYAGGHDAAVPDIHDIARAELAGERRIYNDILPCRKIQDE